MGGSSPSGGSQTTTNVPWKKAQPFLEQGYQAASSDILGRAPITIPENFDLTADLAPETEAAMQAQTGRALQGSPLLGASQDYTRTLLTNPTASPLYEGLISQVRPGVDSSFAAHGRFGSPLHASAMGEGISRAMLPYIESAAQRAPDLAREDYFDIGQLGAVGGARQAQQQAEIDTALNRYLTNVAAPQQRALTYMQALSGMPSFGTSTAQTQGPDQNPLLMALGAAMGLGSTAGGLGWQPFGK